MPAQALSTGWYKFSVKLPAGQFQWPKFPAFHLSDDSAIAFTEFRVGSEPMLQAIHLCNKDDRAELIIDLSEQVMFAEPPESRIGVFDADESLGCDAAQGGNPAKSLTLRCANTYKTGPLRVEFNNAFVPVATPDMHPEPQKYTVGSEDLVDIGQGCMRFIQPARSK